MSYAQGSKTGASSLPKDNPAVTFEDAFTLTLDKLDAAENYVVKLEIEKATAEQRLALEKERTRLLEERLTVKDERLAANEREKAAGLVIEAEKDKQIKAQADRIATLEKKKGGGFFKGFGLGFVAGFVANKLIPN